MWIEKLSGTYLKTLPTGVLLDVNGVGYGLEMPLSSLISLPLVGSRLELWVHSHVREDSIRFFGFVEYNDRLIFELLLSISGVGPKVALALLSTLNIAALNRAAKFNDPSAFKSVPGVGPRLAEKILIELRPKLTKFLESQTQLSLTAGHNETPTDTNEAQAEILDDIRSALENLGFKEKAINPILTRLNEELDATSGFQDALKLALVYMSEGKKEKGAGQAKPGKPQRRDRELF